MLTGPCTCTCSSPQTPLLDRGIKQGPEGSVENRGLRKVLREVLKTKGEARGFSTFPRDLANVNDSNDEIMF